MSKRFRHIVAVLMAVLLLVSLSPVGTASAAVTTPSLSEQDAITLLQTYGIVRGDENGDLGLSQKLTRAQAATVFVRVLGAESTAALLAENVPFSDAVGHWAAGAITAADRLNLMHGDGNGTFRPNSDITYAEVLTVLLRIVGREPQGPWNPNVIMSEAARYGLVPAGIQATAPAIRNKLFWSLAQAVSTLRSATGETILQKYFDQTPPSLVLDQTSFTTDQATATIRGTARDAAFVFVDGDSASLTRTTGQFIYNASLATGANTLTVTALDFAGNQVSADVSVTRLGSVGRIEITGPAMIQTNSSAKLTIKTFDSQGQQLPSANLQAQVTGSVGSFDTATSTLTTTDRTGHGVLTVTSGNIRQSFGFDVVTQAKDAVSLNISPINSGRAPAPGTDVTVKVSVIGADGKVATEDYMRTVTLSASGLTGLSIADRTVTTQAGVATFTIKSTKEGEATLTASSSDLTSDSTMVQFISGTRIVLSTTTTSAMVPDGTSSATIRATLQNENGQSVNNTSGTDIQVSLTATGTDGMFTDAMLTIRKGYNSSSGDDGAFRVGLQPGTVLIRGEVLTTQTYAVQSLSLPVTGTLSGAKLQLVVPTTNQAPVTGTAAITLKVLDDQNRVVTAGSYAFQITLSTSNKETVTGGIPDGIDFGFTNSEYYPVDDGRSSTATANDTYSIVGRTYQGTASLYLRYNKSGVVTLKPKLVAGTTDAYNPTSGFGAAVSSEGLEAPDVQVVFAGAPAQIQLTVDSALGKDVRGGAVASGGTSMTIRARAADSSGAPVPGYTGSVTLTRSNTGNRATKLTGTSTDSLRKSMVNGVAEWTVQTTGTAGYDVYTATISGLPTTSVTVALRTAAVPAPRITAIRGSTQGNPSPDVGYIAPDADYMDIQLAPQAVPADEPTYWAAVKVYRKGESSAFYTGTVDLNQDPPIVHVPKSVLKTGKYQFEVSIFNGFKDSGRSTDPGFGLNEAVNAVYNTSYKLNSGLFDAQSGKLTLSAGGLSTGGRFDPYKVTLTKDGHEINLGPLNVTIVSTSSSSIVLQSDALIDALDPETYHGTVTIAAEDGWFTNADGSQVAQATNTAVLKPLGHIDYGTLDEANRTLYLFGDGFSQGTLSTGQIHIGSVTLRQGTGTSYDSVTATTDTQVTIKLSQTTFDAVRALPGTDWVVTAGIGWLKVGSGSSTYQAPAIEGTSHLLYVRVTVTGASYDRSKNTLTVRGAGFLGATVDPQKLQFRATSPKTDHPLNVLCDVTVVDNSTMTIHLSDADTSFFESPGGFSGKSVYMNTDEGWLTTASGRMAAPIPTDNVLFKVPAQ